jgi:hypothetical protein
MTDQTAQNLELLMETSDGQMRPVSANITSSPSEENAPSSIVDYNSQCQTLYNNFIEETELVLSKTTDDNLSISATYIFYYYNFIVQELDNLRNRAISNFQITGISLMEVNEMLKLCCEYYYALTDYYLQLFTDE